MSSTWLVTEINGKITLFCDLRYDVLQFTDLFRGEKIPIFPVNYKITIAKDTR